MERNATTADFFFLSMKSAFSIFRIPKSGFFVRQLLKSEIESWAQHPTQIVDHLGCAYQFSLVPANLRGNILDFVQAPADSVGTGVGLHYSGI
jgi:hypothetical protein